jgi:hypothetical protein
MTGQPIGLMNDAKDIRNRLKRQHFRQPGRRSMRSTLLRRVGRDTGEDIRVIDRIIVHHRHRQRRTTGADRQHGSRRTIDRNCPNPRPVDGLKHLPECGLYSFPPDDGIAMVG